MASAAYRAARISMAERSVLIMVQPAPLNFAERRSILQVLQQEGQVEFFKMQNVSQISFRID